MRIYGYEPFMRDTRFLTLLSPNILPLRLSTLTRVTRLHAQTSRQNELTHRSTESTQESIEWLRCHS